MKRIRNAFVVVTSLVILFVTVQALGLVGFSYIRPIENDPLLSPVQVVIVASNTVRLADGRVLVFDLSPTEMQTMVRESGFKLELEETDSQYYVVFAKRRRFICGTGAPMFTIRLIPEDIPINVRRFGGLARVQTSETRE